MATTSDLHDDNTWAWPCPYCGSSNALETVRCGNCGVQLRDPEEEELFTTVATENAQVIDPATTRVRESLWSTDASLDDVVDAEPVEPQAGPEVWVGPGPGHGPRPAPAPAAEVGPFSPSAPRPEVDAADPSSGSTLFGARSPRTVDTPSPEAPTRTPFGAGGTPVAHPPTGPGAAPAAHGWPQTESFAPPPAPAPVVGDPAVGEAGPASTSRTTPDPQGLSVAVEMLSPADRERCAVPIGVCGALLSEHEVVLGAVTGHLLGHPAVVLLTNSRVIVANARRWKPLVDVFHPGPDLMVHTRHDRNVAALTFVQGPSLTTVDDISDVAAALDLAERIRSLGP